MKKEVRNYLSIGFLVLAVLVLAYLLNLGITGFAVVLDEYENQEACENASAEYVWYGEACYDEQPVCAADFLELCLDETDCAGVGGYWYNEVCNEEEEPSCSDDLSLCLDETNCTDAGGYWYDGVCNADVEPSCINDVSLCLDETNCTDVDIGNGYWYDGVCNADVEPSCINDVSLCLDETNCTDVDIGNGYWYDANEDGNLTCNAEEECIPNTCESLSYTCGNPDDGCGVTLNCGTCDSDYECSAGSCVAIEEEEETTEEEEETVQEPESYIPSTLVPSLSASEISPLSLNPGSSQKATTVVTNTGTKSLISCAVKSMGEFDSWILVSEETTEINIDGQHEFSFDVTVPEETEEGSYSLKVSIGCSETFTERDFTVNVEKKKLEFEVISADRTRLNRVRIIYSLEELAGEDQDVIFIFSLVDANNVEVGRVEVNQSIDANSTDEFRTNININESLLPINETTNETLESELTLNVNFNSQIYSSSIQEKVLIGAPIGGFAIFEGVGAGEAIIFVIVLFVLVFIFVFARRMRKKGKTLKDVFKGRDPEPA